MKRIKTTAGEAAKKGLIKEGDKIYIEYEVIVIENDCNYPLGVMGQFRTVNDLCEFIHKDTPILIQKPDSNPIDFSVPDRILQSGDIIVKTTGYMLNNIYFTAIIYEGVNKGSCYNYFVDKKNWKDITDTYKSETK